MNFHKVSSDKYNISVKSKMFGYMFKGLHKKSFWIYWF